MEEFDENSYMYDVDRLIDLETQVSNTVEQEVPFFFRSIGVEL